MNRTLFSFLLSILLCISAISYAQTITLVKDITPGAGTANIAAFQEAGNHLFFIEDSSSLYTTDGTAAGTVLLKTFTRAILAPVAYNNKLFFGAAESVHGYELWMSDGTAAGTQMVKDIWPGAASALDAPLFSASITLQLTPFNNKLYFFANDSIHGREIWETDGTAAGTKMTVDLNPVPGAGIDAQNLLATTNKLYFDPSDTQGVHIWCTDGTVAGTYQVSLALTDGPAMTFNNQAFFVGVDSLHATNVKMYATDGNTTHSILDNLYQNATHFIYGHDTLNGKLYFLLSDSTLGLYGTDGTASGTGVIKESLTDHYLYSRSGTPSYYSGLKAYSNKLYFYNQSPAAGGELWTSDGTVQGTQLFKDLVPGADPYSSRPFYFTEAGGYLFCKAQDSVSTPQIWMSDGTTADTHEIVYPGANFNQVTVLSAHKFFTGPLYAFNNQLFFSNIYDTAVGKELYKIDLNGTSVATVASNSNEISVYPNPSSRSFTVQLGEDNFSSLSIYDEAGRTVYTQALQPKQHTVSVHTKGISAGMYYLLVKGNSGIQTKKIVIQD